MVEPVRNLTGMKPPSPDDTMHGTSPKTRKELNKTLNAIFGFPGLLPVHVEGYVIDRRKNR